MSVRPESVSGIFGGVGREGRVISSILQQSSQLLFRLVWGDVWYQLCVVWGEEM